MKRDNTIVAMIIKYIFFFTLNVSQLKLICTFINNTKLMKETIATITSTINDILYLQINVALLNLIIKKL